MKLSLILCSAFLLAQTTITNGTIGGTVAVSSSSPAVILSQSELVIEPSSGHYPPCRYGLLYRRGLLMGKGEFTRNIDESITVLTGPDDIITCVQATLYRLEREMP